MDLRVKGVTRSQVLLEWTQLLGAEYYRVEYRQSPVGSGPWLYSSTSVTTGSSAGAGLSESSMGK